MLEMSGLPAMRPRNFSIFCAVKSNFHKDFFFIKFGKKNISFHWKKTRFGNIGNSRSISGNACRLELVTKLIVLFDSSSSS